MGAILPNPLPPIASFTPDYGIFISSVSKIMSPGLRLALLHVPTQFYKPIWECLYAMHITSPALMTQLFTRLVISGNFDEIRSLRIAELKERNQLFDSLCSELSTIGHLHSPIRWLFLPDTITPAAFEKRLMSKDYKCIVQTALLLVIRKSPMQFAFPLSQPH